MDSDLREYIEWTDVWQEGCDKRDLPRVLLLGDSIISANRNSVQANLVGKFYVDKLATSRSFDQKFYWDQLNLYITDPMIKYDVIFFNFGLHGFHIPTEEYGKLLGKLADRLKESGAKLCYLLTTPMINPNNEELCEKQMKLVLERNEIALKVMAEKNVPVFDQYTPLFEKPEIRLGDPYHYNEKGQAYQGILISEKIKEIYNS